jgi:hypothetical protein
MQRYGYDVHMQDAKEASKWSVKTTKENVRDIGSKHYRAIPIFAFFFTLLCLSFVALINANLFCVQTNVDSARYMLSARVQSQAAILAIVISLTLIAVQLTASAYSPRVSKIFRESLGWQALFVLYGISIFYGLLVLKMIKGATNSSIDLSPITYLNMPLKGHISLAYSFGIFTFVVLILYMRGIIGFLNPTNLINRLAKEISKDKILEYLKSVENDEEVKNSTFEDPIQPIMDIVHGAIMKYDIATTRDGLRAVTDRVIDLIDSDNDKKISNLFCNHLERVGKLAVSKQDEAITVEVIKNLEKIGESTAEKGLKSATAQIIQTLGDVGIIAAKEALEFTTLEAAMSLGKVGVAAAKGGLEYVASQAAGILQFFMKVAVEKEFKYVPSQVARSLNDIGVATVENDFVFQAYQVVNYIREVGRIAVKKEVSDVIAKSANSLAYIGHLTAAKDDLESVTEEAAQSLAELTILQKDIVKPIVLTSESTLKKKDHEAFQKFKELYEQELEKLLTEQKNSKADADLKSKSKSE